MPDRETFDAYVKRHPATVLVEIVEAKGSTPREAGTFMLVSPGDFWGTIGGGQFEFMAIENARKLLAGTGGQDFLDIPLGPEIGQCCGGRTGLRFQRLATEMAERLRERITHEERDWPEVHLFGAGHVGKALAGAFAPLPLVVTVIETRVDELQGLPAGTRSHLLAMPESAIRELPAGSAVIILTHDHALDFLIAKEALARNDLAYIGMIGSMTKRATFARWLEKEARVSADLSRFTLPIGGSAVRDKRPEVIAAMTVAEVLAALHAYRNKSRS
ncbi:xanthine dehydrogenase accessory protein XdhC [Rhizobiaceae bacterium n13]|uniref:Xanthine dehydrogenase accessory protein XdhC n=1 Tax=Ferirhizobium litorale TaxID=2927786 RepID=A0AAE3U0U4_9HYPH|nr:xanthine dehydrogenase accessory protein XdhC [Fererhizobium litorale]MDI7860789.1 xanthine dehydrogenase accessory protein XdhC [Fererhizobium litorale]MDI7920937.1 xanthine dehydrogenase accessory protein XdhC [Fererhizobium litorale]